jgi:hypothetical protein
VGDVTTTRVLALAVAALALAGCADDSSEPSGQADEGPSVTRFCDALDRFQGDFADADAADLPSYVRALKDAAQRLDRVGTPGDMSGTARDGFEITVAKITALPDDPTEQDLTGMGEVGPGEQTPLDALDDYIAESC